MGDILFILLVSNSIIFSFIFWILTFLCKFFYQDKYSSLKLNFYECGFKSLGTVRINMSIQFLLISIFLIIYDSEFLILYPAAFNLFYLSSTQILVFLLFIILLVGALLIDYVYSALDWSL